MTNAATLLTKLFSQPDSTLPGNPLLGCAPPQNEVATLPAESLPLENTFINWMISSEYCYAEDGTEIPGCIAGIADNQSLALQAFASEATTVSKALENLSGCALVVTVYEYPDGESPSGTNWWTSSAIYCEDPMNLANNGSQTTPLEVYASSIATADYSFSGYNQASLDNAASLALFDRIATTFTINGTPSNPPNPQTLQIMGDNVLALIYENRDTLLDLALENGATLIYHDGLFPEEMNAITKENPITARSVVIQIQ